MKKTVKINKVETVKAGKVDRVILHYEVLDGPKKGEVWKIGALAIKLDKDSREKLKASKAGDTVDITIEKDGNYWNLSKVEDAGSAPAKSTHSNNSSKANNDDHLIGIKVGAARNQAIAFLSATKGKNFTLDDVDTVAYDIVKRQAAQENNLRGHNSEEKKATKTEKVEAVVEEDTIQIVEDDNDKDEFGF